MAQTGYTPIQIYHSTTATNVPLAADLVQGELALNTADGKLYYKDSSNVVQLLTSAGTGGGTVTSVNGSGGTTGLTLTGGPFTNTGTLTLGGTLAIANGGTGQITANAALNALLPTQATNSGKVLSTDGTNTSWITVSGGGGGTVTAVNAAYPITVTGTTSPTVGLANGAGAVTGSTGTGAMVCNISPTFITPILGTPTSVTLTNATGLPLTTGVTGTLPVANGGTGVTTSTGSGNNVLSTSPTLVTPILGTPTSGNFSTGTFTWPTFNQNTTGNAATVTNGVYTTGSYANPAWITSLAGSKISGTVSSATSASTATTASGLTGSPSITVSGITTPTVASSGSTITFAPGGSGVVAVNTSNIFFPNNDNTVSLGSGGNRWSVVYAANGTIQTSDGNEKQQIENLTAKEKAVGLALKGMMKSFKFNDSVRDKGPLARIHFGVIAQDVKAAFEAQGLNAHNYGVFCSDVLEDGSTRLGVRYDELFALIIGSI